jgi:hypothetical protein
MVESVAITVDCDATTMESLVDFWAAALDYVKLLPFLLLDPHGVRPRIAFQAVPEPKITKNRWHLDLYVESLEGLAAEVARLVSLGASEVRDVDEVVSGFSNVFTLMTDPQDNEFCVCAPHLPVD